MTKNYAIIEVKHHRPTDRQIMTDLEKLATFVRVVGYRRAIYLIYGGQARQAAARVSALLGHMPMRPPIDVWIHERIGGQAEPAFPLAVAE